MLLDAAAFEFERRGVAGTRIEDIAQRAGVTRGALYFHFKTVERMAGELVSDESQLWATLVGARPPSTARGLDGVRATCLRVLIALRDAPRARAGIRIVEELGGPDALSAFFDQWQNELLAPLQQAIADRQISDSLDIRETASVAVQNAWGLFVVARARRQDDDVPALFEAMWQRLLHGIEIPDPVLAV